MNSRLRTAIVLGMPVLALATAARAESPATDAAGIEFFENKIRPLLVEHCHRCHGPDKQEGNLRLDRAAAIAQGGDRGPAIVPRQPDKSWLIVAVGYQDEELQMPPKGRLSGQQIADLTAWVARGAPAPPASDVAAGTKSTFDLAERRQHWSYQPVRAERPPHVKHSEWVASPIDAFILAKLEAAGLEPAAPADKRTLIRRLTFDLIGLPPTPAEIDAFASDESPRAYERLVERLLASPHYGERWGRHWLDLVRYAETLGHEFDYELHNAWRYRDYVVRAFNADLPYDQFLIEHLAGDLLPRPRRHPSEGFNESILGTGFFWLGEGKHSPVDIRQEQANRIDNQIDVLGKTFLAQTIACARCHDHKFDAITAQDYYALAGYLKSTRYQQAIVDSPAVAAGTTQRLRELKAQIRKAAIGRLQAQADRVGDYLLAATEHLQAKSNEAPSPAAADLDRARIDAWVSLLQAKEVRQNSHPLYAWHRLVLDVKPGAPPFLERADALGKELSRQSDEVGKRHFDHAPQLSPSDFAEWLPTGEAFANSGLLELFTLGSDASRPIGRLSPRDIAHSGRVSNRLEGVLRSPTFEIDRPFLHFYSAGRGTRINLVIDGFTIIRNPIYGGLTIELKDDRPAWRTMDLSMWQGHRAYVELVDSAMPNLSQPLPASVAKGESSEAWLAVDEIRWSDRTEAPPLKPHPLNQWLLIDPFLESPAQLARHYNGAVRRALDHRLSKPVADARGDHDLSFSLVNVLLSQGLLDLPSTDEGAAVQPLVPLLAQYRQTEATGPLPAYAPAAVDGTGEDEYLFHRGNYRTPGDVAPRRLSEVLCDTEQPPPAKGSGRLGLARRLVDPDNPLVARVIVNRIWQHHFGEGLVRSPDDFGRMGQAPTHPELLDYLANELVNRGWSIKRMHRLMLLSHTYRMSSRGHPAADVADPENKLLHRMPIRRLEAEAIRDAVLAVSGRLDRTMGGPSVMPYLTSFMEGRGRPGASGPLDGNGRRSLYINVRRNFLTPMFLAFDYPIPFSTIGRRTVSNVPAQALSMMNGPFIAEEAKRWAEKSLAQPAKSPEERIAALYQQAYGRPATAEELNDARAFLGEQAQRYSQGDRDPRAWADLCHVLFNVKEFMFID